MTKAKILHVAYSLSDESAATRIAKSLSPEIDSLFYLGRKSTSEWVKDRCVYSMIGQFIGLSFHICNILMSYVFLKNRNAIFSFSMLPFVQRILIKKLTKKYRVDFVFIHWGGFGFFSPSCVSKGVNSVIILHDYYQVTAGCHIPMGCKEFEKDCSNCPLIRPKLRWLFKKNDDFENLVALSSYSKKFISKIKNIEIIGNPISDNLKNLDLLNLNEQYNKNVVHNCYELSFVSVWNLEVDNKGFDALKKIIYDLEVYSFENDISIIVNLISGTSLTSDVIDIRYHKYCKEDRIIEIMSKSDLVLLPSKYETFSQVCLESISCGTPVVAFDLTGPRDIIIDGKTGILVNFSDISQFSERVLGNLDFKRNSAHLNIEYYQATRERFSQEVICKQYKEFLDDRFE